MLFWTKGKGSAYFGEIPEQKRRPLWWEAQVHIWVDHSHLQLKVINQQCTVSLLHTNEFHSESAFVSPVCCKANKVGLSSVQLLNHVQFFATLWTTACQASLSITNSQSSLRLTSSHLILCCPLLLLPSIPPRIRVLPMSQLIIWGGQSTGVSALASVLPKNTQD